MGDITSTKNELCVYKNVIRSFWNKNYTNLGVELEKSVKICMMENKELKKESSKLKV